MSWSWLRVLNLVIFIESKMAFVATCMDKAMDAILAGAGAAKKGVTKVLACYVALCASLVVCYVPRLECRLRSDSARAHPIVT